MKKFINWSLTIGFWLGALWACAWIDFHAWQLSHPGAPLWTYFFK